MICTIKTHKHLVLGEELSLASVQRQSAWEGFEEFKTLLPSLLLNSQFLGLYYLLTMCLCTNCMIFLQSPQWLSLHSLSLSSHKRYAMKREQEDVLMWIVLLMTPLNVWYEGYKTLFPNWAANFKIQPGTSMSSSEEPEAYEDRRIVNKRRKSSFP